MNQIAVYQSQKAKVGKRIASTKVKHSFYFNFGSDCFELNHFISFWSKRHRVVLNHQPVIDTKTNFDEFSFKILIKDHVFEIAKDKDSGEYDLRVNGEFYDTVSQRTTKNKSFEFFMKNNTQLRLTCCFSIERKGSNFKLIQADFGEAPIKLAPKVVNQIPPKDESNLPPNNINKNKPHLPDESTSLSPYDLIEDSGQFYSHNELFLPNKEEHEDPLLVATAREGI